MTRDIIEVGASTAVTASIENCIATPPPPPAPPVLRRQENWQTELHRIEEHFGCSNQDARNMLYGYIDLEGNIVEPDTAALDFLMSRDANSRADIHDESVAAALATTHEVIALPQWDVTQLGENSDSATLLE